MRLVDAEHIQRARDLLSSVARRTPLEHSRVLAERVGGPAHLKCENLQRTGSFKVRGAYVRLHGLPARRREAGVVAASAGNHAQGVAFAAAALGIRATVYMPDGAPLPKLTATTSYGAHVVTRGTSLREALAAARAHAQRTGAEFIHPFDHADTIAGQGTVGSEILEQLPEVRTIVVPTGGGGLLSGIAAAVKTARPEVKVVGVQASTAAAWPVSLAAGKPLPAPELRTMADGIAVPEPGELTFGHVREHVDEMLTVTEEGLSQALLLCLERSKLVAEPSGVAAVAALLEHPDQFVTPTVAVLSGGNIDPLLLLRLIRHGMTSAGRYLVLSLRIPDQPGALAGLLTLLGNVGANVVDVEHSRISGALAPEEVEVAINVETRGSEHRERVVTELRHAGYLLLAHA